MATAVYPYTQYSGIWNLSSQANAKAAGTWTAIPGAPTIGTATAGYASASVTFTAPTDPGVPATITGYIVTSSPGGFTGTGSASPITVSGLANGTAYTFTVQAINSSGTGPASAASNSITTLPNLALYGWGYNGNGQLGIGVTGNRSSPVQVGTLTNWSALQTQGSDQGNDFTLVAKNNGTLWSFGNGGGGALGLGNTTSYSSPKQVGSLTDWLLVTAGYASGAVKKDGTLWMWGYGDTGQLGLGNTTTYSSPKQVGALTNWAYVKSSFRFTIAIKTNGTLWSWGRNSTGQLGLGNTTDYSSPKQVGSGTTWLLAVASGSYTTSWSNVFAIKTDGTLWAWGGNVYGSLGLGNTTAYSSPKQVGALTNWLKISASYGGGTIAVKTDGTLWTWGRNNLGQLGLGNTTYYSSPKQVGSLTGWTNVTSSVNAQMAIRNGTLWSWGSGNTGQLGLGNVSNYSSPVQVGALTSWYDISANDFKVMALIRA